MYVYLVKLSFLVVKILLFSNNLNEKVQKWKKSLYFKGKKLNFAKNVNSSLPVNEKMFFLENLG